MMRDNEPKAKLKLAEFEQRARDARDSWVKEILKGDRIEARVKKVLNESMESMIWYIIGLEKRWGNEWSISRVNGREPAVYQEVMERARAAAKRVVDEALKEKPTLSKPQRDAIRKAYIDQLAYKARDEAGERGARDANDILQRVLDEMDENEMPFCPKCQVRHLEPLHALEGELVDA